MTYFRAFRTIIGPKCLTAVFGTGTGVATWVWSPDRPVAIRRLQQHLPSLLRVEAGVVARLLETGEIDNALALEDEAALQDAKPIKEGKVVFDAKAMRARHLAMVKQLPAEGLAVIVLGGSHGLRRVPPMGALYVWMTPRSYPEE